MSDALHDDDRWRHIEPPSSRQRELERRHWRRRIVAVIGLAAVVALVAVLVSGGGRRHQATHAAHAAHRPPAPPPDEVAVDRVLAYTPFVTRGGGTVREIALTFDDGPGPYSGRFVSELRRLRAPATFFTVGFLGRWFSAATRSELAAGDVVGDHTERHRMLGRLGRADQRDEIVTQTQWVHRAGGRFPRLFRPPYGSFDRTTFALLRKLRMLMVLWSVDTDDYRQPGAGVIVARALAGARPGAIILMHDGGGNRYQTLVALPTIVKALRRRGYRLVTVPQLLRDDPPPGGQPLPHSLAGG